MTAGILLALTGVGAIIEGRHDDGPVAGPLMFVGILAFLYGWWIVRHAS